MPCGPTFSPKGSGAELGSLQLAGSLGSCRCSGPFSFVGGERCSPNLPKTDGWKRAEGAVDLLLQEVPRYVVMIDIPQQGEAVHHIETKAKLDAEWLPRFNDALKEFGMVGHVVAYTPSCMCRGQREVITGATRLMLYSLEDPNAIKQMQYHDGLSAECKKVSDRFFSAKQYAPHPQRMARCA